MVDRKKGGKNSVTPTARPHSWTIGLAIASIIISLIGGVNSCRQTAQTQKVLRLHIEPLVKCAVRHSSLPSRTNDSFSPELVVFNEGPIKAISPSVSCQVYVVDTNSLNVYLSMSSYDEKAVNRLTFLEPELEIGKPVSREILGVHPMGIFVVQLSYYRETDMKKFSSEQIFVYESSGFSDHKTFQQRKDYPTIMHNLRVKMLAEDVERGIKEMPKNPPTQKGVMKEMPGYLMSVPP